MSAWVAPGSQAPRLQLPPGIQVAGIGRRTGAWILDRFIAGFLAFIPFIMAIATGAVGFNQDALDQLSQVDRYDYHPFANVTSPLLHVNNGPLVLAVAVYIALNALYYAGSWIKFGGTPGQRALGLRVADYASGTNLPVASALLRWGLLEGVAGCIGAVFLVAVVDRVGSIPTNQWLGGGSSLVSLGAIGLLGNVVSGLSSVWLIVLIVSASAHPLRQGLHDRLVESIVVEPVRVASWPGYPPQAWPGYPPQGPGWGYPPQGPGYPPQGSGYPPQAWPGYPPQAAPPTQPAPDSPPRSQPPAPQPPAPQPPEGTPGS